MKLRLPLFLFLATSALWLNAARAHADNSFTVIDANDPVDTIIFTGQNQFVVDTASGRLVAAGNYSSRGPLGILLTFPSFDTTSNANAFNPFLNSGGSSVLTQIFDATFAALESGNNGGNNSPDLTGPMGIGGGSTFDATAYDEGNSILIVSNDNTNILSLIRNAGDGTLTIGNGGGGNSPSGGGNPTGGNPGGGDGPSLVPEPSTWALLLGSLGGLLFFRRFRFSRRVR
jgi:hypothetical protein